MSTIRTPLQSVSVILLAFLFLPGCNALNPLCGSARPAPVMGSLSADTITFSQVQAEYVLTVNGSKFVASSVIVVNGTSATTKVVSDTQLQVTLTDTLITGPGTAEVKVYTPSGNTGDLGCSSGGTSSAKTLTIT